MSVLIWLIIVPVTFLVSVTVFCISVAFGADEKPEDERKITMC